jgi:ubiquinone/menaquinone biosynthesis C-methylase UbiE
LTTNVARVRRETDVAGAGSPNDQAALGGQSKTQTRQLYDTINDQLDSGRRRRSIFLNFGYAPGPEPDEARVDSSVYLLDPNSARLIFELIGDADLSGRAVLDVGCGRGGTVSLVDRHFDPRYVMGIDLSWKAVAFCRARHRSPRVSFLEADAERLPFQTGTFDVVTNVESSHCYPDIEAFYREVARVIAPGGWFLYTDVLERGRFEVAVNTMEDAGLVRQVDRDITPNVLRSLEEEGQRHLRAISDGQSRGLAEFLGLPGSNVYRRMESGEDSYRILRLRKAA